MLKDPGNEWQETISDVNVLFNFFMKVFRKPTIKIYITFNDVFYRQDSLGYRLVILTASNTECLTDSD
jgi:hypothetical protein